MIPLSTLGTLKPIVGPETVTHYNNYPSALINGGAAPGYSSGQAVAAMQRAAAIALPRDFTYEWTGITYQELKAGSVATGGIRPGDCVRVPDPRGAVRKLDDAVHGVVRGAFALFGAL